MDQQDNDNLQKSFQRELIKWGVMILGTMVVAGAVTLANRNVYSKEEVDYKLQSMLETRALQFQILTNQLGRVEADVKDIKQQVNKKGA